MKTNQEFENEKITTAAFDVVYSHDEKCFQQHQISRVILEIKDKRNRGFLFDSFGNVSEAFYALAEYCNYCKHIIKIIYVIDSRAEAADLKKYYRVIKD